MNESGCTITDSWRPDFDASRLERCVVWLRNLWHWRTRWAVNHLSKQLQRDPEFRESWHANIAMPIYDVSRPGCNCPVDFGFTTEHEEWCHLKRCQKRGDVEIPIEQANYIADRLLRHLFKA